jgi:hypothetical protein
MKYFMTEKGKKWGLVSFLVLALGSSLSFNDETINMVRNEKIKTYQFASEVQSGGQLAPDKINSPSDPKNPTMFKSGEVKKKINTELKDKNGKAILGKDGKPIVIEYDVEQVNDKQVRVTPLNFTEGIAGCDGCLQGKQVDSKLFFAAQDIDSLNKAILASYKIENSTEVAASATAVVTPAVEVSIESLVMERAGRQGGCGVANGSLKCHVNDLTKWSKELASSNHSKGSELVEEYFNKFVKEELLNSLSQEAKIGSEDMQDFNDDLTFDGGRDAIASLQDIIEDKKQVAEDQREFGDSQLKSLLKDLDQKIGNSTRAQALRLAAIATKNRAQAQKKLMRDSDKIRQMSSRMNVGTYEEMLKSQALMQASMMLKQNAMGDMMNLSRVDFDNYGDGYHSALMSIAKLTESNKRMYERMYKNEYLRPGMNIISSIRNASDITAENFVIADPVFSGNFDIYGQANMKRISARNSTLRGSNMTNFFNHGGEQLVTLSSRGVNRGLTNNNMISNRPNFGFMDENNRSKGSSRASSRSGNRTSLQF